MTRFRAWLTGLAPRLFAAQVLIVLSGAATIVVVAVLVAPGVFHTHLDRAVGPVPEDVALHVDRAFEDAVVVALGTAVLAALATTTAVSWFLTRRITRPVQDLADAAERIAAGAYDTSVPRSRLGSEFGRLDSAFNRMAHALATTEHRRRALLSDLAHELRTPVATIDSFLEGVEDGILPPSSETWGTMRDQTARLRRLVEDIGTVSLAEERRLHLDGEPVDLVGLVREATRSAEHTFRDKAVELSVVEPTGPAPVRVDRDRIGEVLDNLLTNAARHTPSGGHVTVTITSGGGTVRLVVADDGEGIEARHLPHVFERFYRADPARSSAAGGSGIGLAVARALVEAHRGTITAASDGPGRGARFVVTLPCAD